MHRRTFAKTVAAAALTPSNALALGREPRISRFTWGDPSKRPRPPVAQGIVVLPDKYDGYLFVEMNPSDGETFCENYLSRGKKLELNISREPASILSGIQEKLAKHDSDSIVEIVAPEANSSWTSIFDLPLRGRVALWSKKGNRFAFNDDCIITLDRSPEEGRARQLLELGFALVLVSVGGCPYLVIGDIDFNGWVEV